MSRVLLGCGVALQAAAWLTRVSRGSVRVRRGSARVRCGSTVARRLAVRQVRVRISARHPRGGPLPSGSNEEIKSGSR